MSLRRTVRCLLPALIATLVAAAPASAQLVRLPGGRTASFTPMAGTHAAQAAQNLDDAFDNLDYSGGPVMASNTNVVVVWQPSNYTGTSFQSGYTSGVGRFFSDLQAASGSWQATDAVSSQYYDASGANAAFAATYGGTLPDTDPLPGNGCAANTGHICLTDAQLQSELDSFLAAHSQPADLTHEYFLLTPPSVASCFDSGSTECSANADQHLAYCAYHSETSGGYLYANIPDLTGVGGCDPFVTFCPASTCQYDNGPADGVLSAISHEHNESTTDPQPNNAWTDWGSSSSGGEIGDKCNGDAFNDPAIQLQPSGSTDTPYNQTLGGDHYLLQMEWSNQGKGCQGEFNPAGTIVDAGFSDSLGSGTTVNFDAGASSATGGVAEYVWQFNDAGAPWPQTTTVETTSPTISHTFPATGTYTVALTVMAHDGTSAVATATVAVGVAASPAASFAFASASGPGSPVTFTSNSTDPGSAITGYAWNFGDGAQATTQSPTHTFPQARNYTVTLDVSDAAGLTSSSSRVVALAGPAPQASFTLSPGTVAPGTAVSFDGSASSQSGGSIAAYAWRFGDGATATGATASHAYTTPGTYSVTLTVTGADGQQASTAHTVQVAVAAPQAVFSASSGQEGTPVLFDGTGSTASAGIFSYLWQFGDGGYASGGRVTHTFAAGTYAVKLTVTDDYGHISSVSHTVVISDEGPSAGFTAPHGRSGQRIVFTGWGRDPDGGIVAYRWGFGDGTSTSNQRATHVYRHPGRYMVTLTVRDSSGQSRSVSQLVTIVPARCVVPRLRGRTLAQARRALAAAGCAVGHLSSPRRRPARAAGARRRWVLVVARSTPGAGARPRSSRVALTLAFAPVRASRMRHRR